MLLFATSLHHSLAIPVPDCILVFRTCSDCVNPARVNGQLIWEGQQGLSIGIGISIIIRTPSQPLHGVQAPCLPQSAQSPTAVVTGLLL